MFFGDDHKKIATVMAGRRNSSGDRIASPTEMKPEITKTEDGEIDGRHSAAQDMIAAFHEKSPERLSQAMKNFMDIHNSMPESSDEAGSEAK